MTANAYVQYGCGFSAPAQWTNFDASPTLRLQRLPLLGKIVSAGNGHFPSNVIYGDIVKGLPLSAGSCEAIYCSHVLEHLSLNDFRIALLNTRRLLRAKGIFRLVVPDLRTVAERYVAEHSKESAMRFMTETSLGVVERHKSIRGLLRGWLGNSQHLWMWDFDSLLPELQQAGFTGIRRAQFADSEDPMFAAVEEESRWVDAVGIQCYA